MTDFDTIMEDVLADELDKLEKRATAVGLEFDVDACTVSLYGCEMARGDEVKDAAGVVLFDGNYAELREFCEGVE